MAREQNVMVSPCPMINSTIVKEYPARINYFGVRGTLGLSDDANTSLGDGGFSLTGRILLADNIAVHTASVLSNDATLSFALTDVVPIRDPEKESIKLFPFAGAGVSVETDGFTIAPLISVRVNAPLSDSLIGTARINAGFNDDGTDIGLVLGIGIDILSLS